MCRLASMRVRFQFTPLREGRLYDQNGKMLGVLISIHAPPRGATRPTESVVYLPNVFQFTPLREGRPAASLRHKAPLRFQFTPLREGRPMVTVEQVEIYISIHAPPRGATRAVMEYILARQFQFTPLREGRPHRPAAQAELHYFNSRPSARGDTLPIPSMASLTYFNSRPSARGDRVGPVELNILFAFQFTPLREGRRQKICNFCKSFVQPLQISMA